MRVQLKACRALVNGLPCEEYYLEVLLLCMVFKFSSFLVPFSHCVRLVCCQSCLFGSILRRICQWLQTDLRRDCQHKRGIGLSGGVEMRGPADLPVHETTGKNLGRETCFSHLTIRPQLRRDYPLNLSISVGGGKENNNDFPSNCE